MKIKTTIQKPNQNKYQNMYSNYILKNRIPPSPLLLSTVAVEHEKDKQLFLDQITTQNNIQLSNTKEIGQHIITDNIDTVISNDSVIGINHTSARSATNSKPPPQRPRKHIIQIISEAPLLSQRRTVLKTWFIKNIHEPYPTEQQKHQFMLELNMTKDQGKIQ
jgi:hypothetical protein